VGPTMSRWCASAVVGEWGSGHGCAAAVVVGPVHAGAVGRGRAERARGRKVGDGTRYSCGDVRDVYLDKGTERYI